MKHHRLLAVEAKLAIGPHEAHVWISSVPERLSRQTLRRYLRLLDRAERSRYERVIHLNRKNEFLVSRALVRLVLAKYTGLAAHSISFEVNKHGKPALASRLGHNELQFNLSNTDNLVAMVVCKDVPIGIDVERIDRSMTDLGYERWFAAEEAKAISHAPTERRSEKFFELWTLKEAFLKAIGTGLATPLNCFAVDIRSRHDIRISTLPPLEEDPSDWHLALMQPTDQHLLSVAMKKSNAQLPEITLYRAFSSTEAVL